MPLLFDDTFYHIKRLWTTFLELPAIFLFSVNIKQSTCNGPNSQVLRIKIHLKYEDRMAHI